MFHKPYLLLIIMTGCFHISFGQTVENHKTRKHTVYAEIGTSTIASALTLNYEPELFRTASDGFRLNGRIGLGTGLNYGTDYNTLHGGLAGMTMLFGKGENRFSLSGGWILGQESMGFSGEVRNLSPPLFEIGWRFESHDKPFMSKISIGTFGLSIGAGFTF